MNHIEDYLQFKDWGFKLTRGQYLLDTCPLNDCGPGHFYIGQENELYFCQKCGETGHLLWLKKKMGDIPKIASLVEAKPKIIEMGIVQKYHEALLQDPFAMDYLGKQRGFTSETIKKFMLGLNDSKISIPYFKDGECRLIKYRPLKPKDKKYVREDGFDSLFFNVDNAKVFDQVIITEGEFDAIAYDQMGYPCVISIPNGAGSFPSESIEDLDKFKQVYFSYDMDTEGRKGVEKAVDKVGRYRALNVLLPLKDANDCLKAGFTKEEIEECIRSAKRFDNALIKGGAYFTNGLRESFYNPNLCGIMTGWEDFDKLIGGLRLGELTVLTGETGSGKSTWATNLAYKLALKSLPILIAGFEMKPQQLMGKMIQMKKKMGFWRHMPAPDFESGVETISKLPVKYMDVYGEIGLESLRDGIYYSKRRYDTDIIILDHLHFFLKYTADHERQAIDTALKEIKSWAMELNIHVILVVHPTKVDSDTKIIRLNDLKGSSGLKQIPDNVISIWREKAKSTIKSPESESVLYLLKVRDDSGDEGNILFTFDKRSQSYKEQGGK